MKQTVKITRRMEDWRLGDRLENDFEGKKNMFWRDVKRVMNANGGRDEMGKDLNGQMLRDGLEVRRRWAEYFEQVRNVEDVREGNKNVS